MNTAHKKVYVSPAILRQTALAPRVELLAGSVVDTMNVTATDQQTQDYDFSDDGFNHNWE